MFFKTIYYLNLTRDKYHESRLCNIHTLTPITGLPIEYGRFAHATDTTVVYGSIFNLIPIPLYLYVDTCVTNYSNSL